MKNGLILDLEAMFQNVKYSTLEASESYKIFQNSRRLRQAAATVRDAIKELIENDNPEKAKDGNIDLKAEQNKTFAGHYTALLQDETEVTFKKLHWNAFDALCKENSFSTPDIDFLAELLLMDEDLHPQEEEK